jgi:lysophospholipase L1-like esterase
MPTDMMAIGDSLYNGVRSLTIGKTLAANSVPAQVARAFDWNFAVPDYPRVMLADFEKLFSDPRTGTLDLCRNAAANAHAWLADATWSQQPIFHNLSIGQQMVSDLATANYADSLTIAQQLATPGAALPLSKLPILYQALNTCFVLNPQRTPNDRRTAIDIVAEVKPKRLLVNIGVNDGLWTLLLMGDATDFRSLINPIAEMTKLAAVLNAKCASVQHFYINLLPKPSAIANLMPRVDNEEDPRNGYFQQYLGRLLQSGGIDGATMREVDDWVHNEINPRIRSAFGILGPRAHFVDLYAVTADYDRKNGIATRQVLVHNGRTQILIDNPPLQVLPIVGGQRDGGLFGLDNLHPTIVGYGLFAQAVCDAIAAAERVAAPTIDMQACYDADTLLHHLPPAIALADFVLTFIGGFIRGGAPALAT